MTRPHAHVMEDKSRNYVSTIVTNQGWIYRNREKDYGIDAELEIVRNQRPTGEIVFAQLKSIGRLPAKRRATLRIPCHVRHVEYWLSLAVPVILVVYTDSPQQAHWVCVQQYVVSMLDAKSRKWSQQKYVSLHVPLNCILAKTLDEVASLPAWYRANRRHATGIRDTEADSEPPVHLVDDLVGLMRRRPLAAVMGNVVKRLNMIERGILELRNTHVIRRHFENYLRAETLSEFGVDDASKVANAFLQPGVRRRLIRSSMPPDMLKIRVSRKLERITFIAGEESWSISRPERLLDCSCRFTGEGACPLHRKISRKRFAALWGRPVEFHHLGTCVVYQGTPKYPAAWPPSLESLKFGTIIADLPKLRGGRVADVGCGAGYLGVLAADALSCKDVTFVDWMPSALVMAAINLARSRAARRLGSELRGRLVCSDGLKSLRAQRERFELLLCNPPYLPDLGVPEMRTIHSVFGTDLLTEALETAPDVADVSIVTYSSLVAKEVAPHLARLGTRARILNPDGFEMPFSVSYALDNSQYVDRLREEGRVSELVGRRHRFYHRVYWVEIRS